MLKNMQKNKIKISDRFNLKNKVCLITGGAGLIGTGFSRACANAGATVIVVDIDDKRGNAVAKKINRDIKFGRALFYKCDITSENDVRHLIRAVLAKFKRIDALVNNAFPRNKNWGKIFEDVAYEDFCQHLDMHVGGYFLMTKEVAKVMEKQQSGGAIVNMGSIYGVVAPKFSIYENATYEKGSSYFVGNVVSGKQMTMPVEYSAIKAAILNLTKYWASYLGKYNIRVNAMSPGGVFDNQPQDFVKKYSERVVLGRRMAEVEDLDHVLVFLLSDAACYITGQNIIVDGGWSL